VARDLGLGRMMSTKKDFVGRTMAARPALIDPRRPTLVGLKPCDLKDRLRGGAHLLTPGAAPGPQADDGYVTSTAFSPSLGHWIGLALLSRGPERIGERIRVYDPIRSGDFEAVIVSPVFLDPEGAKLRG
jgi:sarcosine oxidase subunit alpha